MNLREHLENLRNNTSNLTSNASSTESDTTEASNDDEAIMTEFMASQILESSLSYLCGAYFAYCKLLNLTEHSAQELMTILNTIPEDIETKEQQKNYFTSLKNSIGNFLIWYLIDN